MRELEKTQHQLNLLHKYKKCIIRIHFPNRLVLQTVFKTTETVLDIINYVRKYLVDESLDFSLCKTFNKQLLTIVQPAKSKLLLPCFKLPNFLRLPILFSK